MGTLIHSSWRTKGLYCDGRGCFEVLVRRKNREDTECYWCGQLHGYFDPTKVTAESDCPKAKLTKKPWKPEFNRGRKEL